MTGLTRIMRPGAGLSLLLSATARDTGVGVQPIRDHTIAALRHAYRNWELAVTEARPATAADVKAAHSSWAKRLSAGQTRPAWLLRATWRSAHSGSSAATVSQLEYLRARVGR